ncbi:MULTISPECIES: hypothetical protein [unclassified Pseudomonas]|uniref:hypothetical protein n=1 Tax=unclassified Pseudomonas TaxID=196821 RepID=UPI00087682C3|nr:MULTISPECIES: hypothetical protein [unclassified Pseudomonas]SCZ47307.1 hypothetical protein SAMN03159405_06071 [Pseudomonas sp. NFACC44-2]SDA91764.1 hypothetical protein SAMN03159429_06113 [Pseudomonas sp. NFACC51]SDW40660.1 hypothetical protein SAMN03159474_00786 [Pseudomonas sp. NFACC08-1]SFJ53213.1 hypothetical protein SAMN03159302_06016 [Pseudomonas sp. NFACC54]SFT30835.1 hypothetical protein SAMN03159306_06110 [Pseudomonas sp. NFACC48-1]
MSKLHYPIFLSFLAALSTGCTSNISSKHATAVAKVNIEPGYQYRLPKTSFDVTADFEATGCTIDPSNNTLSILYAAKVKIEKIESGDPDASYILDYEALDALTKLTRMELATTPTGLLTSAGAKATDLSGPLIVDSVKTVASVATAIALPQAQVTSLVSSTISALNTKQVRAFNLNIANMEDFQAFLNKEGFSKIQQQQIDKAKQVDPCTPMKEKLAEIESIKGELHQAKADAGKIEKLRQEILAQKSDAAWLKSEIEFHNKYKNTDQQKYYNDKLKDVDSEISKNNASLASIQKSASRLPALQSKLDSEYSKLRFTKKSNIQPGADKLIAKTISVDQSSIGALINFGVTGSKTLSCPAGSGFQCIRNYPEVQVKLENLSFTEYNVGGKGREVSGKDGRNGVFYRIPGEARLIICEGLCSSANSRSELTNQIVSVSQYGTVGNITLRNGMFADNQIDLVFHENGTPKTLAFDSKARSEAARQAAVQSAETVLKYVDDRNAGIRKSNKGAQEDSLAQVRYEKDLATEREAITQILNDSPANSIDAKIKSYEKQIELLRVQRRLEEERKLLDRATETGQ